MQAQQLAAPGPAVEGQLRAVELPDPEPGPGELILDVAACAVCRTDLQLVEGDLAARRLPLIPGHQAVGRVVAVGEGVGERLGEASGRAPGSTGGEASDAESAAGSTGGEAADAGSAAGSTGGDWSIGERAGVTWLASACGECGFCRTGRENLCAEARFIGWDVDGGYADRIRVRAEFALRLLDGFDDLAAAPLLCGGVIGYRSLRVSGIQPGGRLGLYGFGASALLAFQVAKHWGCEIHVRTRAAREQERAASMGAASVGAYEDPAPPLDAAVTFAPSGDVVVAAIRSLERGATVAINAIHLDRIPEFSYDLLWPERRVASVANFTRTDATEFLALAAEIPIRTATETFPMADANLALARLARGELQPTAVLVNETPGG